MKVKRIPVKVENLESFRKRGLASSLRCDLPRNLLKLGWGEGGTHRGASGERFGKFLRSAGTKDPLLKATGNQNQGGGGMQRGAKVFGGRA